MGRENPRSEYDLGAAEVLPDAELAAFLADLTDEDRMRVDLSEPGMIVINSKDGRLIDKLPRSRIIMAFIEDEKGDQKESPIDTLDHVSNLLKLG